MDKQFYTYLHCKPNGDPFYVGKGCKRRAYKFNKRNPHHSNLIKKYGVTNILIYIFNCDSEEQAFSDEIRQITQLRKEGYLLANKTDGGEGTSGRKWTSYQYQKMKGNKHGVGVKYPGRKYSPEQNMAKSIRQKGKSLPKSTCINMSISRLGRPHPCKKIICPHCDLTGSAPNMKRWHLDNCKYKKDCNNV